MNILKNALLTFSFMAACSISGIASAAIISDSVEANPDQIITFTSPYTFTHNILDNGYLIGKNEVVFAHMAIRLTDNTGNEEYEFILGMDQKLSFLKGEGNVLNNTLNTHKGTTNFFELTTTSLADLSTDGMLSVTINSLNRNDIFYFASSTLNATVEKVPEPATAALLGLGLLGFAASRRRSTKSKNA